MKLLIEKQSAVSKVSVGYLANLMTSTRVKETPIWVLTNLYVQAEDAQNGNGRLVGVPSEGRNSFSLILISFCHDQ
jgi:hypothetical protein